MKEKNLARNVKMLVKRSKVEDYPSLTVTKLAQRYNVHYSYLSRSFRKYNKVTLSQHLELNKIRLFEEAVRSLKRANVKEALALMKIRNASHFIKSYKKIKGYTPGQFCSDCREEAKQGGGFLPQ